MATRGKNLSSEEKFIVSNPEKTRIGIIVSDWNKKITNRLLDGAKKVLEKSGIPIDNILVKNVPGTFELPLGAQYLLDKNLVDGVICIGCVIQGETKHFDFICQGVTRGIVSLNLRSNRPVVFCVLTDNTLQQAIDRSGGQHGNKGVEAAVTALKMVALAQQ